MTLLRTPLHGLLALSSLALFSGIALYLRPLEPSLLALQFSFNPHDFQAVIAQWQGDALQRFRLHFIADFALLLCYGLWGYSLMSSSAVAQRLALPWRTRAAWLMPLAATADALENLLQLYLLGQNTTVLLLYFLTGTAALLKWLLLTAFIVLIGWLWAQRRPV